HESSDIRWYKLSNTKQNYVISPRAIPYLPTATPAFYTLSLHDALPIFVQFPRLDQRFGQPRQVQAGFSCPVGGVPGRGFMQDRRSEEHTSELQSREKLVCRLLLEKKNNRRQHRHERCYGHILGAAALSC